MEKKTGSLGDHGQQNSLFNSTSNRDNPTGYTILGPKHFIVEEENEALLAKEFQDTKIHSTHNSQSSMHSSQPHLFNVDTNDSSYRNPNVKKNRIRIVFKE